MKLYIFNQRLIKPLNHYLFYSMIVETNDLETIWFNINLETMPENVWTSYSPSDLVPLNLQDLALNDNTSLNKRQHLSYDFSPPE